MTGNEGESMSDSSRDQMELPPELRRQLRMFDTVMASVQDFVYLFDLSGRLTYANKALLDLWQKPLDQAVGKNFHDLGYPHDLATRLQRQIEEVITNRRPLKDETPFTSAFGTRQYEYIFVPLFAADGAVEAVAGVTRDITERKQEEQAIREREERFRALLDKGTDMITVSDPTGRIIYASPTTERVSGYTADELQGTNPFMDSIHPDDVERCREAMEHLIASPGLSLTLEHRARHKSGAWRWFEGTFTSLFHDPAVGGLVANVRDITARKAAEGEMARAYAAEQTAHAEAAAALRIRDQFLSIASHELRTPLTSLMGYADMLGGAGSRDTATTQKIAARIARQARRLNALIEQLLDVSRLQQGQFVLERRLVDVAALAEHVVDDFRSTLPAGSVHTLELLRPDEPLLLAGDSNRIEEVLHNLLSNAVKYSPQGGPIQLRITRSATEAILEVEDQGIGIPAQAQARLFDPFYRAPNAGTRAGGFGLGLHIVGEIVQRHGGRIEVTSTENVGSTFRVVLALTPDP